MTRSRKVLLSFLFIAGAVLAVGGAVILVNNINLTSPRLNNSFENMLAEKLASYEIKSLDKETKKLLGEKVSAESAKKIQKNGVYRLVLANEIYREADKMFWDILSAAKKPVPSKRLDYEANIALYEKYVSDLNQISVDNPLKEDFFWQVSNNKANAKIYEIFLQSLQKEDVKKLQKLAKNALDEYVKALDYCGPNKECVNFVGQNIDWLTRMPPKAKDGQDGSKTGGGLGNLFIESEDKEENPNGGSSGDKDRGQIYMPGVSPGQSIKGAH